MMPPKPIILGAPSSSYRGTQNKDDECCVPSFHFLYIFLKNICYSRLEFFILFSFLWHFQSTHIKIFGILCYFVFVSVESILLSINIYLSIFFAG